MKEHHFVVEIAEIVGIEKAIILYNLDYWIQKNVANNVNFIDGKYWTYNSIEAFGELFPYLKKSTLKRTLSQLKNEGYILVENHNENKWDKTNWYALNRAYQSMVQKLTIDGAKTDPSMVQKLPIEGEETDLHARASSSHTDNKPDNKHFTPENFDGKEEKPSSAKGKKETIKISADEEFKSLWADFGKRGSKPQTFAWWNKLKREIKDEIIVAAKNYKLKNPDPEFWLHLKTFINQKNERWKEYLKPAIPKIINDDPMKKMVWH